MGGGDGAGRELWGALSGAASEYAQMGELKGEHPAIPSLVNSLAASKTLWGQSMLVLRWCGIARRGVRAEIMFGGRFANARIRGRASEGRVNQHAGATCL